MESLIIIILGLVFYWLMVETKWLTVRLVVARVAEKDSLNAVVALAPTIILLGFLVAAGAIGLAGGEKIVFSVKEHEEDMKKLWKIYGRKQPQEIRSY